MKKKDVYMFPIFGSAALLSLYLIYKFLPKEWVNLVVRVYFMVIGFVAMGATFSQFLETFLPMRMNNFLGSTLFSFKMPSIPFLDKLFGTDSDEKEKATSASSNITILDVFSHILTLILTLHYGYTNFWVTSNLIGISFCIQAIGLMNLGSFINGAILLSGLFFYDVFWVFGTDVMVSVAKNFDGPIKLLFPAGTLDSGETQFSMLGLGDIVIPGIFIALMLRLDFHLEIKANGTSMKEKYIPKKRFYFLTCLFFYFLGLCMTLWVMYAFKHAQVTQLKFPAYNHILTSDFLH